MAIANSITNRGAGIRLGAKLAAIAGVAALALTGCSAPAAGGGDEAGSGLQAIQDKGSVTIGVCLRTPPWGQLSADGTPEGWDVDLANYIADGLEVEADIIEVTTASRIPSLQSGKVDMISCNFTVNEERKKQIDFSDPVIVMGNSILTRADSDIQTVEDLTGKNVAVTKGGTSIEIMQEANPDAILQPYESPAATLLAVKQGQADAKIDKSTSVTLEASKDPELREAAAGDVGPKVNYGLGLKKGQPELLEKVNELIADFHAEGVGATSYENWFGAQPSYHFADLVK